MDEVVPVVFFPSLFITSLFHSSLYVQTLLQMYENIKLQYSPQLLKPFFIFHLTGASSRLTRTRARERKATTKHAVSPKVLTLITKIADYKWRG